MPIFQNLRISLAKAIIGSHAKDFIPPLSSNFGFGDDGARLKTYQTKRDQLTANLNWSYAANRAIVDDCAAVEFRINRRQKDGSMKDVTDEPDERAQAVLTLLANPNNAHTGEQMAQLHYTYLNFNGEGYTMMVRNGSPWQPTVGQLPHALEEIPAHLVDFKLGDTYSTSTLRFNNTTYPLTYFIRDINPDPNNPYIGQSIIQAAASVINSDEQMRRWNNELIANGAKPSLIFNTNEPLSDDAFTRWKQQFEGEHTGADAAGKPLLVEGGDAKPYMLTPQDLDFLQSREFTMKEILAMWKVSPYKLGLVENVNKASAEIFDRKHAKDNTVPRLRQWVNQLNATMVKVFDPDLELTFENPVPEDVEQDTAVKSAGVNKWITINEAREEDGLPPIDNGDDIYIPNTNAPLSEIAAQGSSRRPVGSTSPDSGDLNDDGSGTTDPENDPQSKALRGVKKKI